MKCSEEHISENTEKDDLSMIKKKNCSDFGKTQKMNSGAYLNGQRVPREALNTPKEP